MKKVACWKWPTTVWSTIKASLRRRGWWSRPRISTDPLSEGAPCLARGPASSRWCYGVQYPMNVFTCLEQPRDPRTFLESKTIDVSKITFFKSLYFKFVYCIVFFRTLYSINLLDRRNLNFHEQALLSSICLDICFNRHKFQNFSLYNLDYWIWKNLKKINQIRSQIAASRRNLLSTWSKKHSSSPNMNSPRTSRRFKEHSERNFTQRSHVKFRISLHSHGFCNVLKKNQLFYRRSMPTDRENDCKITSRLWKKTCRAK